MEATSIKATDMNVGIEAGVKTTLLKEFKKDWTRAPNLVTEARLILSPVAAILYLLNPSRFYALAMVVFVLVAATDKIDGWMARRVNKKTGKNNVTLLGIALDPIVDKGLVVFTLVALSIVQPWVWLPTAIIFAREMHVFLLLRRARRHGRRIGTIYSGKVKMTIQCLAIALLFLPIGGILRAFVWAVVLAAVVLTLTSWKDYLDAFAEERKRRSVRIRARTKA